MKLTPWYLAALAGVAPVGAMVGVSGAVAGHAAILAVTLGIFFGTLSLGRSPRHAPQASQTPLPGLAAGVSDEV